MQVTPDLTLFPVNWTNAVSCLFNRQNFTHVFKLNLEKLSIFKDPLFSLLSPEEKANANRYSNLHDQHSSIIRWGVTRLLIAKYCGILPESLYFKTGKNGKPQLIAGKAYPALFFNLTYSGNFALIAVSNRETGIDIELLKPGFKFEEVLDFVFSTQEKKEILASQYPLAAFYCYFTRKEAIVKALGTGIHDQLPNISVLGHDYPLPAAMQMERTSLQLISFIVTQQYTASLAFYANTGDLAFYEVDQKWLATEMH